MTTMLSRQNGIGKRRPTLRYGDQLGPYVITGLAGRGATSFVYRARRVDSSAPVAIKVLHPDLVADPRRRLTFYREARIMMRMDHRNVVRFEQILESGGHLAFVMEYIDGPTLSEWSEAQGRVEEMGLACLFIDILRGLKAAHDEGVIHRDLKPGNILITEERGRAVAKIIDFGVARFEDESPTEREKNKIIGTAAYISPEEVGDPDKVGRASDLYSLGVMLYEIACGTRPFEEGEARNLLKAHVRRRPQRPREKNPGLSTSMEAVILRSLAKSPQGRFESAPALMSALEDALSGAYGEETLEPSVGERQARPVDEEQSEDVSQPGMWGRCLNIARAIWSGGAFASSEQ